jgi:large-conductance mechanosensitive channel
MNFFFVALVLFAVVKLYNRLRDNSDNPASPAEKTTNELLAEIRDELRRTGGGGGQ